MRIDHLELQNFRVLERFAADFDPHFNVIIGENGRGKTTILEVLRRVLSCWSLKPCPLISPADTRTKLLERDQIPFKDVHDPATVGVRGQGLDGENFSAQEGAGALPAMTLSKLTLSLRGRGWEAARTDPQVLLPLLVLFSPWREEPHSRKLTFKPYEPQKRLDGYRGALDLHADIKDFMAWLTAFDQAAIQEGRSFPPIKAARAAVIGCLPGCTDIRYKPQFNDVMMRRGDGSLEPLWRLSDGYRTLAALIGEMALRAAILNPGVAGVPANVDGVVLIDEIDLHLHPQWQRHVIADLRRVFPKVQFFATTHSPFIVQSMQTQQVHNLDDHPPMDYWREGIEDIAHQTRGHRRDRPPQGAPGCAGGAVHRQSSPRSLLACSAARARGCAMRPVRRPGNTQTFSAAFGARDALMEAIGDGCSYCETPFQSSVEHILPWEDKYTELELA